MAFLLRFDMKTLAILALACRGGGRFPLAGSSGCTSRSRVNFLGGEEALDSGT
jgi:hypothetical protein